MNQPESTTTGDKEGRTLAVHKLEPKVDEGSWEGSELRRQSAHEYSSMHNEGLARRTVTSEINAHTLVKRPVLMVYLIRSNTTESDLGKWSIVSLPPEAVDMVN